MTAKIELKNIKKSFGTKPVLDGLNLKVEKQKSTVIIGGSGMGKSVTLKCILGLVTPDAGDILFDGQPASQSSRPQFFDEFGMLFQGGALFDSLPIWENITFRLRQGHHKLRKDEAMDLAVEKLKRVGLNADVAKLFPVELSGGMQKRVALARAIAGNPNTIFFDEPTTGLDPIMAAVINDLIRGLVDELGATALTITHDINSMRAIADHVVMLKHGKVDWQGGVEEVDQADNAYLQQFIHGRINGEIAATQ